MNKIGKIFVVLAIIEIVSGIVLHPLVATYWRSESIINYYSPMKNYSYFSIIIGIITFVLGRELIKKKENFLANFSILFIVLSIIFLSDRLLLAKYGTGLWKYDKILHYQQRPNSIFTWGKEFDNKLIIINSEGFHDDEFSLVKANNEFRIFALGNSITMGHGVTKEETFSSQLEKLPLFSKTKINVFNLGVQGYSTEQELEVLKRELRYKPNLIMLEFCLNDITEPIAVNKKFGGSGFDYHMIYQTSNNIIGYFINETGFGRLFYRIKFMKKVTRERDDGLNQVKKLSKNPVSNNKFKKSWALTLNAIKKMKNICKQNNISFVVLIFPYTFQLWHKELQNPQRLLKSFLTSEQIHFIDFTETFKVKILNKNITVYFLDEDHYTYLGHSVIAEKIKNYLLKNKLL